MPNIDLNEILVFIKVAQLGSFTRAAQQLGMPNSTVSTRISSLEKRLGVILLQRTTRQLNLTQVGQAYFEQCLAGLEEIKKAEHDVTASQLEPSGTLRVTAPIFLGGMLLPEVVTLCSKAYPRLNIEVMLNDRPMDLIAERIDLALRAGELDDSTLIAKKLGIVRFAAYASPAYLKINGTPVHPKDLRQHSCIQFAPLRKDAWRLTNGKTWVNAPISEKIVVDDLQFVKHLAVAGNGIAILPEFVCSEDMKSQRLARVLPGWQSVSRQVRFVHLPQRFPSPNLRAFLEVASASIKTQLSSEA